MNKAFLLAALALSGVAAIAQGPTQVWDETRGEWVSLAEFSRRYASLGPGALRLSQVGPTAPGFTADLRLLPDPPRPVAVDPYIPAPTGPVVIRGRVYESPHQR